MGFNWGAFALKLPVLIMGLMEIVEKVRGRQGGQAKHDAVVENLPLAVELIELGAGRDVLNDATVIQLRDEYIRAQALVINAKRQAEQLVAEAQAIADRARTALEAGILATQPQG